MPRLMLMRNGAAMVTASCLLQGFRERSHHPASSAFAALVDQVRGNSVYKYATRDRVLHVETAIFQTSSEWQVCPTVFVQCDCSLPVQDEMMHFVKLNPYAKRCQ
mmetsp:Transcript_11697/g.37191  ORF Transcript_11697/g.37191 Transcript_11697/m.37191 type:complete len:105 (+) Transcript_11697:374-688(+)